MRRPFWMLQFFCEETNYGLARIVDRSWAIRQAYHNLEVKYHDSKWTVEEDLLALSNDIGNFLRLVMTKQGDATMMKYPTHWNKNFQKISGG